jgi:hypothetical protein
MSEQTLTLLQLLAAMAPVRLDAFAAAAGVDARFAHERLAELRRAGLVRVRSGLWSITSAGEETASTPPRGAEPFYARVWRALRQRVSADVFELATLCGQGERDPQESAAKYLGHLAAAGLVVRAGDLMPQRYALIPGTDPGPLAPRIRIVRGVREIWEPNTGTRLPLPAPRRRRVREEHAS